MAVTGMDNHSCSLVDQKDIIILIDYVQRNFLRKYLQAATPVGHHETYHISGTDYIIGFYYFVIDADILFLNRALNPVTGGILEMAGHIFVHAHRFLALIHIQAEMLEHSLLFVFYRLLRVAEILLLVHFLLLVRFVLLQ